MDPRRNPFAPGAGTPPPELVGRGAILEAAAISLDRNRLGRPSRSLLLLGLRGVGKTVLLRRIAREAEGRGAATIWIEAPEGRSLPAMLAPALKRVLTSLSVRSKAVAALERAQRALAGFVRAMRVRFDDLEVSVELDPEPGLADTGDLEFDLQGLFRAVGEAARAEGTNVVLFVDELQYVEQVQLAALITALHSIAQHELPLTLVGAGLPQLRAQTGRAKSYAERLFEFTELGPLPDTHAREALLVPLAAEQVEIEPDALDRIVERTEGYPYFLQEWGKQVWNVTEAPPVHLPDVEAATRIAVASLDESFFAVRFDRLTPKERQYLRAMAELGPGPHRSGDVADVLGQKVQTLGPRRAKLIDKGMLWSPAHGDTAFTVPLFDEYLRRIVPGDEWRVG